MLSTEKVGFYFFRISLSGCQNRAIAHKRQLDHFGIQLFVANRHLYGIAQCDAYRHARDGNGLLHGGAEGAAGDFACAVCGMDHLMCAQNAFVEQNQTNDLRRCAILDQSGFADEIAFGFLIDFLCFSGV